MVHKRPGRKSSGSGVLKLSFAFLGNVNGGVDVVLPP